MKLQEAGANYKVRGHSPHPRPPHFCHQRQVREVPLGLVIPYKDSHNSLKVLILTVVVSYRERIPTKINRR